MTETLKIILLAVGGATIFLVGGALICGVVGFVFAWSTAGLLALGGGIAARLMGTESAERAIQVRKARLRNPQFGVLEAHFGAPVPESLERLYRNTDLLELEAFSFASPDDADPEAGYPIDEFLPADKSALEAVRTNIEEPLFPFAEDGFGNYYCVLMRGEAQEPCPVYFWDHEEPSTLEEMKIADSLDEFVARPRRPSAA